MATNYCHAARRHWDDAIHLRRDARLPNADQLYGLAAECALKAVVVALGGKTSADGDLAEEFGKRHVNGVWEDYRVYASGRTAARYVAPLDSFAGNPFVDWSATQRYAADNSIPSGAAVELHAAAAQACQLVLQRAMYDGIVTA